jgi:hypothetical protein
MGSLANLVAPISWWMWLGAATIIAAIVYIRHDSFLLTDLSYRLPIVGKLARFSKDYSETRRGEWLNVEASLCHDYARHVGALSKQDFERNCEYLRLAYDHGRRPIPFAILLLISVLVLLEGLGFSYLLSSWMALEGSANDRRLLTVAIVVVLAAILVWVTHTAGHQLYRTHLLRSCFQQYQAQMIHSVSEPSIPRVYTSEIVSLRQDQAIDDQFPANVRCANRVATRPDDRGSYAWVWVAAILVTSIAVISTILRIETLHGSDVGGAGALGSIFQSAEPTAPDPGAAAREYAALSSFGILSVIFVVTQLVGMGVGYRYGFAGKQGPEAYRTIRGQADYKTYFEPILRRMRVADLRLTTLHRLMERRLPHEINWERTFFHYVREEQARGATDLQDPMAVEPVSKANGSHPRAGVQPGPVPLTGEPVELREEATRQ